MATQTPNLGLVKPARGEFTGTWDVPMNANSDAIDTAVGDVVDEVDTARGTQPSLGARLSTGLDAAGNILPSPEIISARNSIIYGTSTLLGPRLTNIDTEIFTARQSEPTLRDLIAFSLNAHKDNSVVTAPSGYLTFTGSTVYSNGSVTPVVSDINGYRQVTSTQISTAISGSAGTYYVYKQRSSSGQTVITETGTGTVTTDISSNLTVLNDITVNFALQNVQPGFLLNITSVGSQNLGTYVISTVGYNSNPNNIQIIGQFVTAQTSLNYNIVNPVAPTLNFTATAPAKRFAVVSNKIFVGQVVFDGTNVTSLIQYGLQGHYEGFTSVSLTGGNYSLTIPHNLGYVPTKVHVYASQASDFSQRLEMLASDSLYQGSTTISSGSQTLTFIPPTLLRSAITSFDNLNIYVKNATNGVFYQDFFGVTQTSGFLFVVADR